jgi:hypothetical protein
MTFELRVNYRVPSKESLFLGAGWELARDAHGAYISEPAAEILIGNWALSRDYPSTLKLVLSMSRRANVDGMLVRASGLFGLAQTFVQKSRQSSILAFPLFSESFRNASAILLRPTFGPEKYIEGTPGTMDLVALDELHLTRQMK